MKSQENINTVAAFEEVDRRVIEEEINSGRLVLLERAQGRGGKLIALGNKVSTKVNVNIGTSSLRSELEQELEKLRVSVECQADTVMDLSTGGDLEGVHEAIIASSPIPVGTVPIYDVLVQQGIEKMTGDDMLRAVEKHGSLGVDFITVHCAVTRAAMPLVKNRTLGVVSRGGAALMAWMRLTGQENPLYERFDEVMDIAKHYDMALSLGDGLRPGALKDAGDGAQMHELCLIGELVRRSKEAGVKVIVEGPGHVPLDQVTSQIKTARTITDDAPLYVLGPLVLDSAAGWDHLGAAIGGAVAASAGAAFLCYVTPAEHLGLPGVEEVRAGLIATRIAARAGDVAKGLKKAVSVERKMSEARRALDWKSMVELALDPTEASRLADKDDTTGTGGCSMCGEYCSVKSSLLENCDEGE